ncbi:MAG TPA: hypothetical protein DCO68_04775 [Methylophilaceae bacterium]|nr:hypothetical protein [Methylophilaceae bacterium]
MAGSNALPAHCYRDPAIVVEQNQLYELGCRACEKHTHLLGRVICTEPQKTDMKNVPKIGIKCKYFELRK